MEAEVTYVARGQNTVTTEVLMDKHKYDELDTAFKAIVEKTGELTAINTLDDKFLFRFDYKYCFSILNYIKLCI